MQHNQTTTHPSLEAMTIGILGAGNMAEAIVRGLLRAELAAAGQIIAADPVPARREVFEQLGCRVVASNAQAASGADLLVLAVKPQVIDDAVRSVAGHLKPGVLVVSIAAGVSCARLEDLLPEPTRVVRVMPNTPMMVGAGVAGVARGAHAERADMDLVIRIFSSAGLAMAIDDEAQLHAVTALSASGPAYFFRFVEALALAGTQQGLAPDVAQNMAARTLMGAAKLLEHSGEPPATLRKRVTSPGGTTAAALASFDQDQLVDVVARAVAAATRRSEELGQG